MHKLGASPFTEPDTLWKMLSTGRDRIYSRDTHHALNCSRRHHSSCAVTTGIRGARGPRRCRWSSRGEDIQLVLPSRRHGQTERENDHWQRRRKASIGFPWALPMQVLGYGCLQPPLWNGQGQYARVLMGTEWVNTISLKQMLNLRVEQ